MDSLHEVEAPVDRDGRPRDQAALFGHQEVHRLRNLVRRGPALDRGS